MPSLNELPIVKEHAEYVEDYARRIVEEHGDNDRAVAELTAIIDHLTAVRTDLTA